MPPKEIKSSPPTPNRDNSVPAALFESQTVKRGAITTNPYMKLGQDQDLKFCTMPVISIIKIKAKTVGSRMIILNPIILTLHPLLKSS